MVLGQETLILVNSTAHVKEIKSGIAIAETIFLFSNSTLQPTQ